MALDEPLMTVKTKACKTCGSSFSPWSTTQVVCGRVCAGKLVKTEKVADKAKDRARRDSLRTTTKLEEDCRKIVQKIARIRDRNDGCISCDKPASWDGQWHGSHFRSHGAASAVQFHLWNINKACWICNKLYSGRIDAYAPRLVEKIGQDRVDWLKSQNQIVRRDRSYLCRFKRVMGKRLRRMEKRA